jgi:hypothetical protein
MPLGTLSWEHPAPLGWVDSWEAAGGLGGLAAAGDGRATVTTCCCCKPLRFVFPLKKNARGKN